jgi:hypothetical protein
MESLLVAGLMRGPQLDIFLLLCSIPSLMNRSITYDIDASSYTYMTTWFWSGDIFLSSTVTNTCDVGQARTTPFAQVIIIPGATEPQGMAKCLDSQAG